MKTLLCLFGSLLLTNAIRAQSTGIQATTTASIPFAAPGLTYTPAQMAQRLIEFAEGPIPKKKALEKEFGFNFRAQESELDEKAGIRSYRGTAASPPFGSVEPPYVDNIKYDDFKTSIDISFKFDRIRSGINKPIVRYCVESDKIFQALTDKWTIHKKVPGGHHAITVHYTAVLNGLERTLTVWPLKILDEKCIDGFYIQYLVPAKLGNTK